MWIYHANNILDSSNIFSYAAKIRENVDKRFSVENLKSSYDQLRLLQHNYDKLLWVSVHSSFSVIHKVGNVHFILFKFENKLDTVVGQTNFY